MKKTIDYYLNLPYTRELLPEPEGGWFVRIKELPGCMSQGETADEAMTMIEDAMRGWIEAELRKGSAIPEPRPDEDFSGKFVIRVSKSLHRKINDLADFEGVSLNQWINTALAEAVGWSLACKVDKTTHIGEETWPGLAAAVQGVLNDVGMRHEAGVIDEQLFAGWLEQNLEEIVIECQQNDYEQALSKARALFALLQEHENHSPVMHSIQRIVAHQISLLEQTSEMKKTVLEAEKMQTQISAILGSVNSPALGRIRQSKNERHSISTSPNVIEQLVREPEPAGW